MKERKILSFNAEELREYESNRYPFLLIDRVTECVPGKYAKGYKNLTNNEWFFPKHYPGHSMMPGVLQVEALSQMFRVALTTMDELDDVYAVVADMKAKFIKEVHPGDRLDIDAEVKSYARGVGRGLVKGYVDGSLACVTELTMIFPAVFNIYQPKK